MPVLDRITKQQALELCSGRRVCSLPEIGGRAGEIANQLHPGNIRTYIIERNINYTNICQSRCSFCAFSVSPRDERGFTLDFEQIVSKIEPLVALGGRQILLQGGLNPHLSFDWYEQLLRNLKERFGRLHIHGFSPPEIFFFSRQFEMTIPQVIGKLREAGLDTIPGGGAEILVDRVRRLISPAKCSADQWLEVMRQAHLMGICTTATMMFGHVESMAERIEHLDRIRRLQDESLDRRSRDRSAGVFTAFTCWPFQPGGTRLSKFDRYDPLGDQPRLDNQLLLGGAFEQLKMTALSRIYLDNIANIQASWVTQGPKIAQLSLLTGCNDIGSLMMEENVVSAAGTTFHLQLESLRDLITTAGFKPVERDCYYNPLDDRASEEDSRNI